MRQIKEQLRGLDEETNDTTPKNYESAEKFSVYDTINDKEALYSKQHVEMIFMHLMADMNGEKTNDLENKFLQIFGPNAFEKENSGMKCGNQMYTKKT